MAEFMFDPPAEAQPPLYTVKTFTEGEPNPDREDDFYLVPQDVFKHVVGWDVNGDWLVIYDAAGIKTAHRLDPKCQLITTTEETGKQVNHASPEPETRQDTEEIDPNGGRLLPEAVRLTKDGPVNVD